MIKLTFNPESDCIKKTFQTQDVSIGSSKSGACDFNLPLPHLKEIHLKICEEHGRYFVINEANDPFVSLNHIPFRKKAILPNDVLFIGKNKLLFELDSPQTIKNQEIAYKEDKFKETPNHPAITIANWLNWRLFLWIFSILAVVALSIVGGLYLRATGKSSQEEKQIAAGIADIAMALRYARLHNITPQKPSFVDPDFLRSNIDKILSPKLNTLTQIDEQGRFIKHPYLLRIYSNNNLSRFLIIAQPSPNFFHWVKMLGAIVIDSKSMEIKKISDIKALNRLLAHPDPLNGANGEEVSLLLKEGQTMPLPSLAGEKTNWGFTPPTALGFIKPNAENYIYNAPRYHPFGEQILTRAGELISTQSPSDEIAKFRQEIKGLSEFQDLILYSSEGMKSARGGQKALNMILPEHEFLIGSLKFNQQGIITHSQLLMDENRREVASQFDILPLVEADEMLVMTSPEASQEIVDINHPIFLRLNHLAQNRKKDLKPVYDQIVLLLNKHSRQVQPDFQEELSSLLSDYKKIDKEQQSKIAKSLPNIWQESQGMPVDQFMRFVEAAELANFAEKTLYSYSKKLGADVLSDEDVESKLALIEESESLKELDELTQNLSEKLTLDSLPDPDRLIVFQNKLHITALGAVERLLFSEKSPIVKEERDSLERILKNAWVQDSEEYEFFLNEFDKLQIPTEVAEIDPSQEEEEEESIQEEFSSY